MFLIPICGDILYVLPVSAQTSTRNDKNFSISSGELKTVLESFAVQGGITLSYEPQLLEGKKSAGLSGRYTVDEGLKELLSHKGLEYELSENRAVVFQRVQTTYEGQAPVAENARPGQSDEMVQLKPVRVVGSTFLYDGYQTREVTGAHGIPVDPMLVPISVSTITPQLIEDIGATRMEDALDFVSGVSRQNEFGGLWDNYAIRGFTGDINRGPVFVRDGVRANRGYTGKQDAANLERVEILKGASSALFGRSDPGGTVNIVTKRPKFDFGGEVTLSASDNQPYRGTIDLTGPLRDNLAARLNLAAESGETFRDKIDEERYLVAPALTWEIGSGTRIHYDGEFVRQDRPLDRGLVAINNDPGVLPISRFLGELDDGDITLDTAANRIRMQQNITDFWSAKLTFAHMYSTLEGFSTEASRMLDDRLLVRERRFRDYVSNDFVGVAEVRGRHEIASMRHDLLLGMELSYYEQDFLMRRSNPRSGRPEDLFLIDVFNPAYSLSPPAFAPERMINRTDKEKTVVWIVREINSTRKFPIRLISVSKVFFLVTV